MTSDKALLPRGIGDMLACIVKHLENHRFDNDYVMEALNKFGARMHVDRERGVALTTIPLDTFEKVPEVKLIAALLLLITSKDLLHVLNLLPDLETDDDRRKSAKALSALLGGGCDSYVN